MFHALQTEPADVALDERVRENRKERRNRRPG